VATLEKSRLIEAFKRAASAAIAADPGPEPENDGGTANFDTPAIRLPGIREKFVAECATEAGISVSSFSWFGGKRWFFVRVPMHGQANRRSAMMEAAMRVLEEYPELNAQGYYRMD
jgi:hypothetical protein